MEINPNDFISYFAWLDNNLGGFLLLIPAGLLIGLVFGYIGSAVRHGPVEGAVALARIVFAAVLRDWPSFSLRRTGAIARLAIKEAIRRKVLVVFAVSAVLFLFAGMFLDTASDRPARLYLSFVLTSTTYLVLFLALFLSVFSLPNDIQRRTIYTVATKPVRAGEIVLGRIVGFTAIGTTILLGMGLISYQFVVRGLWHTHELSGALEQVPTPKGMTYRGRTTSDRHHRHDFVIGPDGVGKTDAVEHWHHVERVGEGKEARIRIGPPIGALVARVPKYGSLQFFDSAGKPAERGINVGYTWDYRSYIEGGTKAAAVWTFDGISEENYPDDQITLALNLSVYRSYKGDVETPIRGVLFVINPDPSKNVVSEPIPFLSTEFEEQLITIPRALRRYRVSGRASEPLDLFKDLVYRGKIQIKLQCDDLQQYFGVAQADVYIREPDASFWWNFSKGFIVVWLQMVTLISLSVLFSTFLKAPVALLATIGAFILGYFKSMVEKMARGENYGGGPLEALIRIIYQYNLVSSLEFRQKWVEPAIKQIDHFYSAVLDLIARMLPTFHDMLHMTEYVAYGINIPGALLARFATATAIYTVVFTLVGYFLLKSRELAA